MSLILKLLFWSALAAILFGFFRTYQMEGSDNQVAFLKGSMPNPLPDGFHMGSVSGPKVSWLGKKFEASKQTGINIFKNKDGGQKEKYPFKTYIGKGVRDKEIEVLKIDYNVPENPFWLRYSLDEVV
ncbi:MAG: hypothetical protein AAB597_03530, partial [Patescibacteria group bacterium]